MARRSRAPRAPRGDSKKRTITPPPSNVTDDTIREKIGAAVELHRELEATQAAMKEAQGRYRAGLKACKSCGIAPDDVTWYIKTKKRDVADVDSETRSRNRIAQLMGLPLGGQLGLFDDGSTVAAKVDAQQIAEKSAGALGIVSIGDLADAENAGEAASQAGKFSTDNPHEDGSPLGIRWKQGWLKDQEAKAQKMGAGAAPGAQGEARA